MPEVRADPNGSYRASDARGMVEGGGGADVEPTQWTNATGDRAVAWGGDREGGECATQSSGDSLEA